MSKLVFATCTHALKHIIIYSTQNALIITDKIPCIMNKCLACKETEITNMKSNRLYTHYDKQGKHTVDSEKSKHVDKDNYYTSVYIT